MTGVVLEIAWRTVSMAALATLVMLPPGIALAWLLARRRFPGRALLETLVSLPLVMPPRGAPPTLLHIVRCVLDTAPTRRAELNLEQRPAHGASPWPA